MATSIRNLPRLLVSGLVTLANALSVDLAAILLRSQNQVLTWANIGNGTTAGRLRTNAPAPYMIGGTVYNKASTDDLWNLSGETNTTGAQYRAYWLYLDSSGTASYAAGSNAATAAAAIAALPAITSTKSVIGCYVAGLSCDFDGAGGLAAQGTIYHGYPAGYTVTNDTITVIAA